MHEGESTMHNYLNILTKFATIVRTEVLEVRAAVRLPLTNRANTCARELHKAIEARQTGIQNLRDPLIVTEGQVP